MLEMLFMSRLGGSVSNVSCKGEGVRDGVKSRSGELVLNSQPCEGGKDKSDGSGL